MPEYIGYIVAVLVAVAYAILARAIYEVNTFEVNRINITHKLVKEKTPTFVYFSDLHGSSYGLNNYKIISKINEIKPDAILIGGDMIIGKTKSFSCESKETKTAIDLINRLSKDYPIYYTFGNHETRTKNSEKSKVEFMTYLHSIKNDNLHYLNNTHLYVTIQGTRFCLYGMEADNSYYAKKRKKPITTEYVTKCLGESPEHNHSIPIVLSHHPESFDSIAAWGAEYVLSGHNHGGFIRLPGIGGLIGSDYKLFPKYSAGIYKIKENKEHSSTMLLSRGLGTHTIKFRLFNKPELMVIKFIQKSQP